MQPFLSGFDWTQTDMNTDNFAITQILQAISGLTKTSETLLRNNLVTLLLHF